MGREQWTLSQLVIVSTNPDMATRWNKKTGRKKDIEEEVLADLADDFNN